MKKKINYLFLNNGSIPTVGSSKIMTLGLCNILIAKDTLLLCPPLMQIKKCLSHSTVNTYNQDTNIYFIYFLIKIYADSKNNKDITILNFNTYLQKSNFESLYNLVGDTSTSLNNYL